MPHCAFLTTDDLSHYVADDRLAIEPLDALGWKVTFVPWRAAHDWSRADLVVIRSTWDYHRHLDEFEGALARIAARSRLENPLPVVRWNARKTYLRDLEARGVPVVPTTFCESGLPADLDAVAASLGVDEIVAKPIVGASAEDTFLIRPGAGDLALVRHRLAGRPCMVQPLVAEVMADGEISVVFIGGAVSHAVRKLPREGDFRSQEEHGATVSRIEPDGAIVDVAGRALACASAPTLYGRVDLVVDAAGVPRVMELELIEPSLYLRMDPDAPARLARAIAAV
jgi:glutathione synthase/RimK-type ligase-like ATP-grasp enzyme